MASMELNDYRGYTFYRTFGGGPEGGYITGENGLGDKEVLQVERTWFKPFSVSQVPAMAPENLRLETKSEGGLTFVRVVGEWEQIYDKPEDFSEYCPPEETSEESHEDCPKCSTCCVRICESDGVKCTKCNKWFCASGSCDEDNGANECYLHHAMDGEAPVEGGKRGWCATSCSDSEEEDAPPEPSFTPEELQRK